MASLLALPTPSAGAGRLVPWLTSRVEQAVQAGSQPVSPASTAFFRIAIGLLGAAAVVRFAAKGWISEVYVEPAHHFSYYGFEWIQAWPGWGMYLHFALLGLASLGVALGFRYRVSIIAFFVLFTYVELIDKTTYLNHYYLVSLVSFIMIFLPLARSASLDSRGKPGQTIPRAALWMLKTQVGLVYVFAGIAKLNPDWLLHAEPLRIWLYNSTDLSLIGPLLREPWTAYLTSWAGVVFDLTIIGWLIWKRTRLPAYAALVVFHVTTAVLFPSIGMFPWIMMGATLIFFEPDWPARVMRRLRRLPGPPGEPGSTAVAAADEGRPLSLPLRAALALAAVFLLVQLLAPLRHLAYPGNVRWTEEGYRFSWRVLVTEKTGMVRYRVTTSEGEMLAYPEDYLTPVQAERMAYQPDMILAAAHIVRDDFITKGHRNVEVRADAYVTYNGRPASRLIDPEVDLAQVNNEIGSKPWVLAPP